MNILYRLSRIALFLLFCLVIYGCRPTEDLDIQTIHLQETVLPASVIDTQSNFTSIEAKSLYRGMTIYANADDVIDMGFDPSGHLWTAGRGGIVQWDLAEKTYTHYTSLQGLPGTDARAIAVTRDGTTWVGSWDGKLSSFNGVSWELQESLSVRQITSLFPDPDGGLWVSTNQGIFYLDHQSRQANLIPSVNPEPFYHSLLLDFNGNLWAGKIGRLSLYDYNRWQEFHMSLGEPVTAILEAPDHTIWLVAGNHLVHRIGQQTTQYSLPPAGKGGDSSLITSLASDSSGRIWISRKDRISRLDGPTLISYLSPLVQPITSMVSSADGAIWIGTHYGGISRYEDQTWETIKTQDGINSNFVLSLGLGKDGTPWIGTNQGLSHLEGQVWHTYTKEDGLSNDSILSVAQDLYGNVWAGTEEGVSRFDGRQWKTFTMNDLLPDNRITSIETSLDGSTWIVTPRGVARYDGSGWRVYTAPGEPPNIQYRDIALSPEGWVWLLTSNGIQRYDGTHWSHIEIPHPGTASCLEVSSRGDLWIGDFVSGLSRLDGTIWKQLPGESLKSISINANGIEAITEDNHVIDLEGQYWATYTQEQGLVGNSIHSVKLDQRGFIWVATASGVSLWNGTSWVNYSTNNGLGANDVWSIALDSQGTAWIGTPLGGLVRIRYGE